MNRGWALEDATPIQRLVRPFQEFAKLEASGGILLIGCTIAALNEVAYQVLTGSTSGTPCWVLDQSPMATPLPLLRYFL